MKGTHSVEGFLNWLDTQDNLPFDFKLRFKKKVKEAADWASTLGKPVMLPITQGEEQVMVVKLYDDGSCELGWRADMPWAMKDEHGKPKPGVAPPPRKEIE